MTGTGIIPKALAFPPVPAERAGRSALCLILQGDSFKQDLMTSETDRTSQ